VVSSDANADIAVAKLTFSGTASVLLGDGSGGFAHAPGSPLETGGYGTFSVATGDFNGDGKPDLAFANFDSDDVSVLLNNLIARSDFKNAAQYCEARRASMGGEAFAKRYGTNGNGRNAFGQCVRSSN
jgi:FG-GAP-like repeat